MACCYGNILCTKLFIVEYMNQFINYAFSNILLARTERDAVINYISEH